MTPAIPKNDPATIGLAEPITAEMNDEIIKTNIADKTTAKAPARSARAKTICFAQVWHREPLGPGVHAKASDPQLGHRPRAARNTARKLGPLSSAKGSWWAVIRHKYAARSQMHLVNRSRDAKSQTHHPIGRMACSLPAE